MKADKLPEDLELIIEQIEGGKYRGYFIDEFQSKTLMDVFSTIKENRRFIWKPPDVNTESIYVFTPKLIGNRIIVTIKKHIPLKIIWV